MLAITIKVTGTQEVIDKLKRLESGLKDFTAPLEAIGEELKAFFSGQVFASQGGVLGVRWPTLAVATMVYKRKHYPSYATTPLIRTGAMQHSFEKQSSRNMLRVYNTAPYFVYHQSSAARHKIPYRPMIGVSPDVENIIKKIMEADIKAKIEAA